MSRKLYDLINNFFTKFPNANYIYYSSRDEKISAASQKNYSLIRRSEFKEMTVPQNDNVTFNMEENG